LFSKKSKPKTQGEQDLELGMKMMSDSLNGNNPEALKQLMEDLNDPEMIEAARQMMADSSFKKAAKKMEKTTEFQSAKKAFTDPKTAAKLEAEVTHKLQNAATSKSSSIEKQYRDAMNDPETMNKAMEMMNDPDFAKKVEQMMAADPDMMAQLEGLFNSNTGGGGENNNKIKGGDSIGRRLEAGI
jgi:hypothetical protein